MVVQTWDDPDCAEKNEKKGLERKREVSFVGKTVSGEGAHQSMTSRGLRLEHWKQEASVCPGGREHLRIDTSSRVTTPPQAVKNFKNSPTYIKKGGVLIPEERYRMDKEETFLTSLEEEDALRSLSSLSPHYQRDVKQGYRLDKDDQVHNSTGILDSFLATLNPLEWIEWHYGTNLLSVLHSTSHLSSLFVLSPCPLLLSLSSTLVICCLCPLSSLSSILFVLYPLCSLLSLTSTIFVYTTLFVLYLLLPEYCHGPARHRSALKSKKETVALPINNPTDILPCVHK